MSVRKRCAGGGCPVQDHRCDHTWVADFKRGERYTVRVDEYALLRGAKAHIRTKREAEDWEAKMIVDVKHGLDPRQPPPREAPPPAIETVGALLDDYAAARLPELAKIEGPKSELRHLRAFYGESAPVTDLARPDYARQFAIALAAGWRHDYDAPPSVDGRGLVAVNRIMQRLRNVCGWAVGQAQPRLASTPFHRYGVVIPTNDEVPRRRRLQDGEEDALFAACGYLDNAQHKHAGREMRRRLRGALGLGARQGELLQVRLSDIEFTECTVVLRSEESKASDTRVVPFEPGGALHQDLLTRRFLKAPTDYVFGAEDGSPIDSFRSAWETLILRAHGKLPLPKSQIRTYEGDQALLQSIPDLLVFRDLRREYASRLWDQGVDLRVIQLLLGHANIGMTQRYLELKDTDGLARKVGTALGWKAASDRPALVASTAKVRQTATKRRRGRQG